MKKTVSALLLLCATLAGPAQAWAQSYPSRPIQLIVPFAPGGGTDLLARTLSSKLSESLGTNIIIQYKPGAQGSMGAGLVARAPADGYTVLFILNSIMTLNPWIYRTEYDPLKSFRYVGAVAIQPILVMVNPGVQANSVKDLTALAKARPGAMTIGYSSSFGQLATEYFKSVAGVNMLAVPYKESGTAITDLVAGRINTYFSGPAAALPLLKAGKMRALAVTSQGRIPVLPDVPTSKEAGYPDFDTISWFGFAVPAGTPDAVVAKLSGALKAALATPGIEGKFEAQGMALISSTPQAMTKRIADEYALTGKIVKAAHITAQ